MTGRPSLGRQLRAALLVVGITLGILLLFFLQFALPYWMGPTGLVLVGFVDAIVYLVLHHRRAARRRARLAQRMVTHAPMGRDVTRDEAPLRDELVIVIALLVFVVGFSIEGAILQVQMWSLTDFLVFLGAGAIMVFAALLLWPYEWRFYDRRSESDKYDTTDDH